MTTQANPFRIARSYQAEEVEPPRHGPPSGSFTDLHRTRVIRSGMWSLKTSLGGLRALVVPNSSSCDARAEDRAAAGEVVALILGVLRAAQVDEVEVALLDLGPAQIGAAEVGL